MKKRTPGDHHHHGWWRYLKSPDEYRRQLMMEYALAEYDYVITEAEADEIFLQPHWWEDVDEFVQYMKDVNFGTSIAGTANVALPSSLRVYTDAELDAMEETGDFYPSTPELSPSSSSSSTSTVAVDSLELENEWLLEEEDQDEDEDEDEDEGLPSYGESVLAVSPPTYMDAPEQPEKPEEPEEDETEAQQLDDLSCWLDSLLVPITPHASIEIPAAEEADDVAEIILDTQPPLSPVTVVETHEAVEVTMEVATPAVVEVVVKKSETTTSLLPITAPTATTTTTTRRERFGLRVGKVKTNFWRGLKAIGCSSSSRPRAFWGGKSGRLC
ncbi:hypothetical protein PG994_007055 [Apiospora phragmitis]|uniref:Uncharacterized protein n=1 Tax=Apiospora phragmitis TaxID=2905665 RepID=A0ABR1V0G5_9PEZI